eukprot:GAHX01003160.1.p1 GENE.GAHX01003160.1~~GAHX01003160.1.p1  ORF type:complete len:62 (-),score=2.95 GAHX01003160.1:1-186(-)
MYIFVRIHIITDDNNKTIIQSFLKKIKWQLKFIYLLFIYKDSLEIQCNKIISIFMYTDYCT